MAEESYYAIKGDSLQIKREGDKYERDIIVGGVKGIWERL